MEVSKLDKFLDECAKIDARNSSELNNPHSKLLRIARYQTRLLRDLHAPMSAAQESAAAGDTRAAVDQLAHALGLRRQGLLKCHEIASA